jgi:hypothetical protein
MALTVGTATSCEAQILVRQGRHDEARARGCASRRIS